MVLRLNLGASEAHDMSDHGGEDPNSKAGCGVAIVYTQRAIMKAK